MMPTLKFGSWRDRKGYHRDKFGRVLRNGKEHKDLELCYPLSSPDLYLSFANTCTTPDGVVNFVSQYGPVTTRGNDIYRCDTVRKVVHQAKLMQEVWKRSAGGQQWPKDWTKSLRITAFSSIDATVVWEPVSRLPRWYLRPKFLLDALWLQLGQALTRRALIRQCEKCGTWFEAGRGTGRRADAKFCSEEHKILFHSHKRSRGK
jgi:hypothetical protein